MKTAILFAAGRGQRLRPLTDYKPKPLCEVQGKALISYHLENIKAAGIERVYINHAYLGHQIKAHVRKHASPSLDIHFFPELPGGYRTGGTLLKLLPKLTQGNQSFIAINADIYTDYPLSKLQAPSRGNLAHLVLVPPSKFHQNTDFSLCSEGQITYEDTTHLFSGIACYHPDFFKGKHGHRASITPWLRAAANQMSGEIYNGLWFDVGSLQRLQDADSSLA